jgi:predicted DNA-binding protein
MSKEILRVRLTQNVKQLKKYVDEAIEKGAEKIRFDMDKENPYFIFSADFTPEQQNEYDLNKLKQEFEEKLKVLESRKFKTHSFRIKQWGLCGAEIDKLIEDFKQKHNIKESLHRVIKQVINDDYDDFNDEMQTIFITEVLQT